MLSLRRCLECLALALTLGCKEPPPVDSGPPATVDSDPPAPSGVIVLAGGGSEGDFDDDAAWSASLYRALLEGGDVDGDGLVRVAVLSTAEESDWIPRYFERLGADEAFNLRAGTRSAAEEAARTLAGVDAVFIKGGDQGRYYDLWNDNALDDAISEVFARGGGVGGTSAGAMSLAGVALAGGRDLVSQDALSDAHTPYLDDDDGGSGLHDDFIGLVPGALIDTHFTERGRLGRLAGALAKAVDDGLAEAPLGLGLERRTGLVIRGAEAEVIGVGAVTVLQPTTAPERRAGRGLIWRDLTLHRLTEGFVFDLQDPSVVRAPADASAVTPEPDLGAAPAGWSADGGRPGDEERFAWAVERAPFGTHAGQRAPLLPGALALTLAQDRDLRGLHHELLFAALYEHPGATGFLLGEGASIIEDSGALRLSGPDGLGDSLLALDSRGVTLRARSPWPSNEDSGDGSLRAAALVGVTLHVLGWSEESGWAWDPAGAAPRAWP